MDEKIQLLRAVWANRGGHKPGQQKAVENQPWGEGKVVSRDQPETLGCEEGMQILPVWHQTLKFSAFPGDLQESDPETGRVTSDINPCVKSFCEDNEVQAEFELC